MQVKLNGCLVNLGLKQGRGKATISAKFLNKENLDLVFPKHFSSKQQEDFVFKNFKWLEGVYKRNSSRFSVVQGDSLMYNSEYYNIVYVNSPDSNVVLDDKNVYVHCSSIINVKDVLMEWLSNQTRQYLNSKKDVFSKFNVRSVNVKHSIRKWGSCNNRRELIFNSKLTCLDKTLKEYIVYHEISHLFEMNHSPKFKRKLSEFLPDYKEREKRLRKIKIQ